MRRLVAEGLGSLLLAATVVGSGIMAERLARGNAAVALLGNTGATVAVLVVLIELLRPVSGAHFNPAVTLAVAFRGGMSTGQASQYILLQVAGCCAGAVLANLMFELPPVQMATHARNGFAQLIGEFVATFGLLLIVLGYHRAQNIAVPVAAWIGAAYWFTSSTSFANPAIALARSFSDTFAGIRPSDVLRVQRSRFSCCAGMRLHRGGMGKKKESGRLAGEFDALVSVGQTEMKIEHAAELWAGRDANSYQKLVCLRRLKQAAEGKLIAYRDGVNGGPSKDSMASLPDLAKFFRENARVSLPPLPRSVANIRH